MTRNNLQDQLKWLLRDATLSRPVTLPLPNNDSQGFSSSSSQDPSLVSVNGSQPHTRVSVNETETATNQLQTGPGGALSRAGDAVHYITKETLEDGTMGRLTSSVKSKKPSLISRQDHLLTPTPTTSRIAEQPDRTKPLPAGISSPSRKYECLSTPKPIISGRTLSPTAAFEFSSINSDDLDYMDLTGDQDPSSGSPPNEAKTKPASRTDNKRKSDGISKDDSISDDLLFPDVYELLGTSRKKTHVAAETPSRTRGSQKLLKDDFDEMDLYEFELDDIDIKGNPQQSTHDRSANPAPSLSHPSSSKKRKTSAEPTQTKAPEIDLEMIIPDSDDECMSPVSRRKSEPIPDDSLEYLGENIVGANGEPALPQLELPADPPRLHFSDASSSSTSSAEPKSNGSIAPTIQEVGSVALSADQKRILFNHLASNPQALAAKSTSVEKLVQQNGQSFMRAVSERAPKEKRNEIRAEKERLLKQKEALKEASTILLSYSKLSEQRGTLADEITEAYADGVDTDEAENRLDTLTDQIQEVEETILKTLIDGGVDVNSFLDFCQVPPMSDQVNGHLDTVPVSQPLTQFTVNMAMNSGLGPAEDLDFDVVHRTQLSQAGGAWSQTGPLGSKPSSESHYNAIDSRKPGQIPTGSFGVGDGFPQGPGDVGFSQGRSTKVSTHQMNSRSTQMGRIPPSEGDEFGDFSDDAEILALAQDYESRKSTEIQLPPARRVLSDTSGNAVPTTRSKKSTIKPVKSALPALSIPPELMKHPWSSDVQKMLKDRFRMKGFRQNQLEAINATLAGDDAFVLMPTGGGKSLCYQLPAVIKSGKTRGVTIVISPLLSLMQDQVDHMKALGIQAVAFNSECSAQYKRQIMGAFNERTPEHFVELLYVTPEMVSKSPQFSDALETLYRKQKFARLVIDEAHCVSQWGHDFRPDYKNIGQLRRRFPNVPVMALTATATQNVIVDIKHNLGLRHCQVFSQSFNRPNLTYEVRPKTGNAAATDAIGELILRDYRNVSGIVYTISRKQAEEVAHKLSSEHGIAADYYHAGIEPKEKAEVQTAWQKGEIKVVVATIAFGMGIDKPDVRFVVHHGLPKSLEGYYQETGRAGRDGKPSDCILFYGKGDIRVLKKLISDGEGGVEQKERQMSMLNRVTAFCDNQADCRRTEVLRYFGEDFTPEQCNKSCDNCKAALVFEQKDFSECAVAAINVVQVQRRLTPNQCADILLGKAYPSNEERKSGEWHGVAKGMKKHEVVRVIDKLSAEKAFSESNQVSRYGIAIQYLRIGPTARAFLDGQRRLMLSIQVSNPTRAVKKKATKKAANNEPESQPILSTYVSSPIGRRRPRGRIVDSDDEVELNQAASRYANDGFVVSDDDIEADEEEAFAPLPTHRPARPPQPARPRVVTPRRKAGPPIPIDTPAEDIDEVHHDLIGSFVQEAQSLEERIRNKKELRRPLFSQREFMAMATHWTTSIEKMGRITGIDLAKVSEYGPNILKILARYHVMYREITGATGGASSSSAREDQDIVDLVSSESEQDDGDGEDEEEEEEEEEEEDSHYFANSARPEVQAFNERLQALPLTGQSSSSRGSRGGTRGGARGGRGGRGGSSGGKSWSKKGPRRGSQGSRRRGASTGARKASASASSGPAGASAPSGASKPDRKIVKRSGGGIGLMPI